jgi:PIN like domain
VKVAFDQNVPIGVVRVLQAFANENQFRKISGDFTIKSAADYTPKPGDDDYRPKDDAPWLKRFADDEGRVVISGDVRMRYRPHERLALIEHKLLVIFFENQWSEWKFWRKTALLIHWWPVIASKIKRHKKPAFFHVPCNWVEGGELRWVSNKDPKELKLEQRAKAAKRRKAKVPSVSAGDGPLFEFAGKKPKRKK